MGKQVRENIAESKLSYEIMDDSAQAFLKVKIMDNIQKYFYLISFTSYMREASQVCRDLVEEEKKKDVVLTGGKCSIPANKLKLHKTFVQWMDDHQELRPMIETGKGDLQWERDIPPAALVNLEELARRLQEEHGQDHPRHLRDRLCHVPGHASGRPQEARQVQVCLQDPDEDSAFASEGVDQRPD